MVHMPLPSLIWEQDVLDNVILNYMNWDSFELQDTKHLIKLMDFVSHETVATQVLSEASKLRMNKNHHETNTGTCSMK